MKHCVIVSDNLKVGDKFNAYIRKSIASKTLGGIEKADCPVTINPQIAEAVTSLKIDTKDAVFVRTRFYFKETA